MAKLSAVQLVWFNINLEEKFQPLANIFIILYLGGLSHNRSPWGDRHESVYFSWLPKELFLQVIYNLPTTLMFSSTRLRRAFQSNFLILIENLNQFLSSFCIMVTLCQLIVLQTPYFHCNLQF